MANNPAFHKLLADMAALHDKKNYDYANDDNPYSNFEITAQIAGVPVDTVFDVLIGVKIARLRELTGAGKTPNNESIADTRIDLAMYAALKASYPMWLESRKHSVLSRGWYDHEADAR